MMMRSEAGSGDAVADDADVQEQQRSVQEDGADPERAVRGRTPEGSSLEADPADAQDQTMEVILDDDEMIPDGGDEA